MGIGIEDCGQCHFSNKLALRDSTSRKYILAIPLRLTSEGEL